MNYCQMMDLKEKLIVTLGSKGCRYKDKVFNVKEVPVKDVSGAGDTFHCRISSWLFRYK